MTKFFKSLYMVNTSMLNSLVQNAILRRMTFMIYSILFNPHAGNGCAEEKAKTLALSLGGRCELIDMTSIENYEELLSAKGSDDSIIICGGDGTLNRFINATDGVEIRCPILYFAQGSGNDFLRDLGYDGKEPVNIGEYIKNLPLVEVNGKTCRFLNNVGFGIDGYCCEVGDAKKAKGEKDINYTSIAIMGLLFHFKPKNATVKVDGKEYSYKKVWIAPTMKGRFYGGGMMPTPSQDRLADDGKLSLMLFHGSSKIKTLMIFPSLFKGEHIKHGKNITIHEGYEIEVTFDKPCALQIDGETILGVTSYKARAKVPAKV